MDRKRTNSRADVYYAAAIGEVAGGSRLHNVLARIEEFERRHGATLWAPASLLRRLAEEGKTFTQALT
jgi:hypothetical protein